jgi:hypothetical protein
MGIILNETADASAKESIRKGEDVQNLIPVTYLTSYWKTKLRVAATEWYRESGKTERKYFVNYYQKNGEPWFQRFKFRRKSTVSLNRIRSGHYCLKEHFIRFNTVNTEKCECGKAKETVNHIL